MYWFGTVFEFETLHFYFFKNKIRSGYAWPWSSDSTDDDSVVDVENGMDSEVVVNMGNIDLEGEMVEEEIPNISPEQGFRCSQTFQQNLQKV